jgi:hypothetical protein
MLYHTIWQNVPNWLRKRGTPASDSTNQAPLVFQVKEPTYQEMVEVGGGGVKILKMHLGQKLWSKAPCEIQLYSVWFVYNTVLSK